MSVSDAEVFEVVKHTIEIRDPQNQNDDYQAVQDRFDLSLHRNKSVDKPKHKSYRDNCDDDGGKWHIKRSNLILGPGLLLGHRLTLQAFGPTSLPAS